jgi:hypothetical protein
VAATSDWVPPSMISAVMTGLSFEDVAPGTEGAHYALSIIRKAGISAGQDVLVNGATGAIGSAAVQLLADLGARVTAVWRAAHVERALLRPHGLYLTTDLGPWAQNVVLPVVTRLARGRRVMLPMPIENQEIVEYLRERIASGRFRPVVDRRSARPAASHRSWPPKTM